MVRGELCPRCHGTGYEPATASAERDAAQADTARLDKAIAVLAKFLEARTRERKAEREGGPRA